MPGRLDPFRFLILAVAGWIPDFRSVTARLIWRYRDRRSLRLLFDVAMAAPPKGTTLYAVNVISNDPLLSRISPIAVKILPSAITGRNIQYFRRIAAIAR